MIDYPKLPFEYSSLASFLSKKQVEIHFEKHHKGYVDNLNKLIKGTKFEQLSLEEIVEESDGVVYNNAAQIINHSFFWNSLSADSSDPTDEKLIKAINDSFDSLDEFKRLFKTKAMKLFGSGWTWLVYNPKTEKLSIGNTSNADRPTLIPLLVCDVWEHSYYIDYRNKRADYLDGFIEHINWENVQAVWTEAQEDRERD